MNCHWTEKKKKKILKIIFLEAFSFECVRRSMVEWMSNSGKFKLFGWFILSLILRLMNEISYLNPIFFERISNRQHSYYEDIFIENMKNANKHSLSLKDWIRNHKMWCKSVFAMNFYGTYSNWISSMQKCYGKLYENKQTHICKNLFCLFVCSCCSSSNGNKSHSRNAKNGNSRNGIEMHNQ